MIALEQELSNAAETQRSLMTELVPDYETIDVACFVSPAGHSCGDYLDHFVLPNGKIVMVSGDVGGDGLLAALNMMELRTMIRSLAATNDQISSIANEVNSYLLSKQTSFGKAESDIVTLFMVVFDPSDCSLDYVGAGHSGMLLRNEGDFEQLRSTGFPLGVMESEFEHKSTIMNPGDVLLVRSDGMRDTTGTAWDRSEISRVKSVLYAERSSNVHRILSRLMKKYGELKGGQKQRDDVSILIARNPNCESVHAKNLRMVFAKENRTCHKSQKQELVACR